MNYEESVRALLCARARTRLAAAGRASRNSAWKISPCSPTTLGNPQRAFPCVHIAGTNGKGSTAAMLESILRAAGLRTGLYTSPHLERINERIRLNGEDISDAGFRRRLDARARRDRIAAGLRQAGRASHVFRVRHRDGLCVFRRRRASNSPSTKWAWAAGWTPPTSSQPEVAVITPIDFDHENFLGHSIEEIAGGKSRHHQARRVGGQRGRAARGARGDRAPLRRNAARAWSKSRTRWQHRRSAISRRLLSRRRRRPTHSRRKLAIAPALAGRFQLRNALTAATAARLSRRARLSVSDDRAIERGIAHRASGRAASNAFRNARTSISTARTIPPARASCSNSGRRILPAAELFWSTAPCAIKPWTKLPACSSLARATVILTEPRQPRAISAPLLAEMTSHDALEIQIVRDPVEALEAAIQLAGPQDVIFATGSLYLVGELKTYWAIRPAKKVLPVARKSSPHAL